MVMDLEELEEMDASEIDAKRLNAKEVTLPQSGENCKLPVADETVQPHGEDRGLRTSTLIRNQPVRREIREDFLDESKGFLPTTYFRDLYPDACEARDDFCPSLETSYTAITLNQESNSTRQERSYFLFH